MSYNHWQVKHIIESQQFDQRLINRIFSVADELDKNGLDKKADPPLKGKIMASLFYEPSTRTRFSFESAMLRLGGSVITTENAREFSSMAKGETLEDSIRVINNYADVIVLRHHLQGSAKKASLVSNIPIINAGDGIGQHPTQALLDLYTIKKEIGRMDKLKIALVGDLKYGRTVRSLSYLLGKFDDIEIYFVSPTALKVGDDIKEYLEKHNVSYIETNNLEKSVRDVDVLYQTRIQKERFESMEEYKKFESCYIINLNLVNKMPEKSIIMHPLPRVDEISPEVDSSPKAVYFKQTYYGLLIRMALLKMLLE